MKVKEDLHDVGIIVGRFQVPDLHEAHKELILSVTNMHQKVIIFLGLSPIFDSRNPLDFESRKKMISNEFPDVIIAYIKDVPNDDVWSKSLDSQIEGLLTPRQTCVLYGSRDSFLNHYTGIYERKELVQEHWISGSEMRKMLQNTVKGSKDFRHGAIWAQWTRFPTVFTTVDIAVVRMDPLSILLGRKSIDNGKWRFPGGFTDPIDQTFEASAMRELSEEIPGLEVEPITPEHYIASMNIRDWRYRSSENNIRTMFYVTRYISGQIIAGDDLDEVCWAHLEDFDEEILVSNHRCLFHKLLEINIKIEGKENG